MSPAMLDEYYYKKEAFEKCPSLLQYKAAAKIELEEYIKYFEDSIFAPNAVME